MRKSLWFWFLLFTADLLAQTEPTIGVCAGGSFTICLQDSTYDLCTRILVSNPRPIDSFVIRWNDNGPITRIVGSLQPPDQRYNYNLSSFYNSCDFETEVRVTLFTYYPNAPRANNSSIITFQNPPKASFSVGNNRCVGQTILFRNTSCPSNARVIEWDYGDGVKDATGSHVYNREGEYEVKLTVENPCGRRTISQRIRITGLPTAVADVVSRLEKVRDTFLVCLSKNPTVELNGLRSQNAVSYSWSPQSASPNFTWISRTDTTAPKVTFHQEGVYSITLTTRNICNQRADTTVYFRVFSSQPLAFRPQPDTCSAFLYRPSPVVAGATYVMNGMVFDPRTGIALGPNTNNTLEIRLQTPCDTLFARDTFSIFTAEPVFFRRPNADTVVCQNSGLLFLDVFPAGGNIAPNQYIVRRNDSLFFNPSVVGAFPLTYRRGSGECLRQAQRTITVLAAATLTLNQQTTRCQPFLYRPSPIINGATYTFNGVPFDPNAGIQAPISGTPHEVVAVLSNLCGSDTQRIRFSVTGAVGIQVFSPDSVVCRQGGRVLLRAASSDNSGRWSGTGVTHPFFDPLAAGVGTHILTFSAGEGECANSQSITMSVRGIPNIDAGRDIVLCNARRGVPLPLSGGQPSGGEYRLNSLNGSVVTVIDPSVFPSSARLFYIVRDSLCVNYDSLNVTINSISSANFAIPEAACIGQPISVSAISPAPTVRFRLFINDTLQSSTLPFQYRFARDGIQNIAIEIGNAANCLDTIVRVIDVRRAPIVNPSVPASTLCHSRVLTANIDTSRNDPTTTYRWQFRGQSFETAQLPPLSMSNIGCEDSTHILRLSATTGVCPVTEAQRSITTRPQTRARVALQGADTVCANQLIKFVNNSCGSSPSYTWQIDNARFSGTTPPDMRFENTGDTLRVINIRLIAQDSCGNDTNAIRLWVYPLSIKARFGYNRRVNCQPFTVNFRSQSPLATSILWDFGDGTTSTSQSVSKTFDSSGVFKVRFRAFHPCGGFEDFVDSIIVLSTPQTAGLTFEKPDKCRENQIRIRPRITSGVQGRVWVDGLNLVDSTRNPILTFPSSGSFWVKYVAINTATGCERVDSGLVLVRENLTMQPIIFADSCGNGNGMVEIRTIGGIGSYLFAQNDPSKWQSNNRFRGLLFGERYTFFVQDSQRCRLSTAVTITGRVPLSINVGADTLMGICDSMVRQISANFNIATIRWSSETIDAATFSAPSKIRTAIFPNRPTEINVVAVDSLGCEANDRFKIDVVDTLVVYVPNTFSPNGDGQNDYFSPYFQNNDVKVVFFKIYNRWGGLIHSVENVTGDTEQLRWDGGGWSSSNKLSKPDVFVWHLTVTNCRDGRTKHLHGEVNLVQ